MIWQEWRRLLGLSTLSLIMTVNHSTWLTWKPFAILLARAIITGSTPAYHKMAMTDADPNCCHKQYVAEKWCFDMKSRCMSRRYVGKTSYYQTSGSFKTPKHEFRNVQSLWNVASQQHCCPAASKKSKPYDYFHSQNQSLETQWDLVWWDHWHSIWEKTKVGKLWFRSVGIAPIARRCLSPIQLLLFSLAFLSCYSSVLFCLCAVNEERNCERQQLDISKARRRLKSPGSLSITSAYPIKVTQNSMSWSLMEDSHHFVSMPIGPLIPTIRLFQTLTLKSKVKVMDVIQRARS